MLVHCQFLEMIEQLNEEGRRGWRVAQILPMAPGYIPENSWWVLMERGHVETLDVRMRHTGSERRVRELEESIAAATEHMNETYRRAIINRPPGDHRPPRDPSPSG